MTPTAQRFRVKDPVSGFTHAGGFVVGLVGLVWLLARGAHLPGGALLATIYGACLLVLYLASSLYHLVLGSPEVTRRLRLFDHLAIFTMVAGTATPLFVRAFTGTTRVVMLSIIWGIAAVGVVFKVAVPRAPRWLATALYVAMGWCVVFQWSGLVAALPVASVVLLVLGGVVYTLGAVVYAIKRPNPFPEVFGFHEIWHLFVLAGSALHFAAIALVV